MGQMLSIPFVVIGLFCMIRMPGKKRAEKIDRKI
jgi:prolipoprotein diacylglyceryltransferase